MHSTMTMRGDGLAPYRRVIALGLAALVLTLTGGRARATSALQPPATTKAAIEAGYGNLPLAFEGNRGQTDAQVMFLARGRGYALFLTAGGAVLSLARPRTADGAAGTSPPAPATTTMDRATLAMQFLGADPQPRVTGRDVLKGHVNYLRGNDPAHWQTELPTYAKVAYEGLYPGIDLVYYGNQGQLEYDFVVAPGVDPGALRLDFRGADSVDIDDAGELVLSTGSGEVCMHAPVLYQEDAGVRTPVAGGYVLNAAQEVGFTVAAYDPSRPLVIDPVLAYSTFLGGSGTDGGSAITVDLLGNAYVTGSTSSADFPATIASPVLAGESDAFVAKLDHTGSRLVYATYLGGNSYDNGSGIAVDLLGNAYVSGQTSSADFPVVAPLKASLGGRFDGFVVKLDRTGSRLLYSTYLGGNDDDRAFGIAIDLLGNAYVTGRTNSADFPTVNAMQAAPGGLADAFLAKLDRTGTRLLYSTYLGGTGTDLSNAIAVDLLGNAYVAGDTDSSDFPTVNAIQASLRGDTDAFVTKFDRGGRRLRYSTYLGGTGDEEGRAIAIDLLGNAYVTGYTLSTDFPTSNAAQGRSAGNYDVFVTKLDGYRLLYSTYLGGTNNEIARAIAVDLRGNAYVTGFTDSSDFPTVNAVQPVPDSVTDAFATMFDRGGKRLIYSTHLGGIGGETGTGIAVDARGNAYVTGETTSSDFPTTAGSVQVAPAGDFDAFVVKLAHP